MKIVISHVYSTENKGDAALQSVLIGDVRRQYKDADITVLTFDTVKPGSTFEGAREKESFMFYAYTTFQNKLIKLLFTAFVGASTLLWALFRRWFKISLPLPAKLREVANVYAEADLILPVGGGYIRSGHSLTSSINLFLLLHPLLFGYLLRKPTVLYTQSIGPFYRGIERWAVHFVLSRMNLIILREEKSRQLLESLGVKDNVVRSVDSGFLFTSDQPANIREKFSIPKDKLLIGVTVRKWLDKSSQEQYESSIAHIIDYAIMKYDAAIVFVPQVTAAFHGDDDRKASQDVYSRLHNKDKAHVVMDDLTHYQVKSMYDELDFIVGTRFHSVIFSLTSYVPALAIEYEHKTSGIMDDLGLSEWVIKIEDTEPKLLEEKFDALIANRESYVHHLHQVLPPYIEQAKQAIVLADRVYQKARG